jgi:hypothetical protein
MGTPLTEERFLIFVRLIDKRFTDLEARMSGLETRMSGLETHMSGLETRMSGLETRMSGLETQISSLEPRMFSLEKQMTDIQGFQKHESDTIEFELHMLLTKHLELKYPLKTIIKFPMKRLYNPFTNAEITELDAAFLLSPMTYKQNYSRLHEAGIYKKYTIEPPSTEPSIFIMAEAKHNLNAKKVAEKLNQFDLIRQMFYVARNGYEGISDVFRKTLKHNKFMTTIETCVLFFGAAYWEPGLLFELREAVKTYKNMANMFESAPENQKVSIFRKALELDSRWRRQPVGKLPPTEYIIKMHSLEGSLKYIDFIIPSGSRYVIPVAKEPEPWHTHRGGGVTRKVRN